LLFSKYIYYFNQILNDEANFKLIFFSGHDINIFSFAQTLGIKLPELNYSARLLMEIYETKKSEDQPQEKNCFVKFELNGEYLQINGKDGIKLEDLISLLQDGLYLDGNYEDGCFPDPGKELDETVIKWT
jgi:hypothetical protein